ncbi:TolC family protein [Flammeovirga yaeyamensis]|uniref:TolC family protein n=2 Tax=Flammeovirga yaeyamensis TaxID=367791 RepID=A0AAX1N4N3_9BACT|nr:TolC family protein [Flammeovirga yaeyamensis]NMF36920.1 TolC family protein [Flammeovirga yaeyamensis]QWG02533.1 TolC family protein [Flammeovirga yaeyamensis]
MQKVLLGLILMCMHITSYAQENKNQLSLSLTLPQGEEIFLEKNLTLVAERHNIDIAKAEIIQAKAWPNPELGVEIAMYDNEDNKWFRTDSEAQRVVEIHQLIEMGGKRKKRTNIAQKEAEIAEYEFYTTMRELRTELRSLMVELHYLQEKSNSYLNVIEPLERLIEVYKEQSEKGNIAKSEVVRLKALLLDARKGWLDIEQEATDVSSQLKLILNLQPQVDLTITLPTFNYSQNVVDPELWVSEAQEHRMDFKIEQLRLQQVAESLALEKAENVPDIELGTMYDRRGAHQADYWALQIAFDLPVWNRNKGGIQAAKIAQEQQQVKVTQAENQLQIDVYNAAQKLNQITKVYDALDPELSEEMRAVMESVTKSYQKQEISLIEFIDFFESYKENLGQLFDTEYALFSALELINYTVGKDIYPIQ